MSQLLNKALPNSQYGDQFTLVVMYDDGTSNGQQYCVSMQYFTLIDHRSVFVEEVLVTPPTATLIRGEQLQITATVLPSHATNPNLIWSSSDPEIASVSQNGLVTALSPGLTTIRATAQDGSGVFGEAIIEVVAPSYQLSFSWGDGGILSALVDGAYLTSPAMLEEGTVVDFTASPDVNYVLDAWWLNGEVVDTTSYTLELEINQNHEVFVDFKLKVGVEELSPQLFPQYTEGVVRGSGLLRVYDLSGRVMLYREINGQFVLPQLPAGMYVLQVGSWRKKIFLR